MPCVDEVCVGDNIFSLRHIAWLEVKHPSTGASLAGSRVTPAYLEQLRSVLRAPDAVIESVAPYWYLRRFDSAGLASLERVRTVCQSTGVSGRLQARYAHDENNETAVIFEPSRLKTGDRLDLSWLRYGGTGAVRQIRSLSRALALNFDSVIAHSAPTQASPTRRPSGFQPPDVGRT